MLKFAIIYLIAVALALVFNRGGHRKKSIPVPENISQ